MGIQDIECLDEEGGRRTKAERDRLRRLRLGPALQRTAIEEEQRRLVTRRNDLFNAKLYRERKAKPYKMAVKRGEVATIDGTPPEEVD